MGNVALNPTTKGEQIVKVDIPANGHGVIGPFQVKQGQALSYFNIHAELNHKDLGPFEAALSDSDSEAGIFATASGRSTGSNQPHLQHSDSGVSKSLNLSPGVDYYYLLSDPSGHSHTQVNVGYLRGS